MSAPAAGFSSTRTTIAAGAPSAGAYYMSSSSTTRAWTGGPPPPSAYAPFMVPPGAAGRPNGGKPARPPTTATATAVSESAMAVVPIKEPSTAQKVLSFVMEKFLSHFLQGFFFGVVGGTKEYVTWRGGLWRIMRGQPPPVAVRPPLREASKAAVAK
ncbi:hypothetical protein AMAG_07309 [Allomyces macrogynus ATCC 38327]|uniref:Uncharacterized protein n=1 Tax=Allomyces macrogynus (strain ATCC 38327) TaxID=578462 RepID=A0A0L0SHR4_ALLM3|nr:hypothetical protein AMAG_07309 [Allomyces macrogynus ATCC 38327]|eukprot:KNE62053.1 hypothetical protein AMAG_07309 [Allomyces macrogynus ATCC 38327]